MRITPADAIIGNGKNAAFVFESHPLVFVLKIITNAIGNMTAAKIRDIAISLTSAILN